MRSLMKWGLFVLPLVAAPAFAQTPPSPTPSPAQGGGVSPGQGGGASPGQGGVTSPGQTGGTAPGQVGEETTPATPPVAGRGQISAADRRFVAQAASENQAEVMLGRLALQRGQSDDVKQFAQRMIDDHTRANEQLSVIANDVGITMPAELNKQQRATYDRLSRLSGEQFDQAYLQHMTEAHERAVSLFQRQADRGRNPRLREFATQTLPTLRTHHDMAQREQRQM